MHFFHQEKDGLSTKQMANNENSKRSSGGKDMVFSLTNGFFLRIVPKTLWLLRLTF